MPSSLPTLAKTWQYTSNQIVNPLASQAETGRATLLGIKNALKAFGTSPWTVVGSSNGSAFGLDAVDRWVAITDFDGGNEWIVLKQTGVAANFQMLWVSGGFNLTVYISQNAGFTGGGALSRPTATDEVVIASSQTLQFTGNPRMIWTAMQSSDGNCTRMFMRALNVTLFMMVIEKLKNPVSGLTVPWASWFTSSLSANVAAYGTFTNTSWKGYQPGVGALSYQPTLEAAGGTFIGQHASGQLPNDLSGGYFMSPGGILCSTASARGRHGDFFDLWFGSSLVLEGDTYPGAAESPLHQFQQLGGCVIFPNNLAAPVIT